MSNAKKITVAAIKVAYDLSLAHFEANPEEITGDVSASEHVVTTLSEVLTKIGYQRAANLGAVIKSHEAKLKRGGARSTKADLNDVSAQLFQEVTGHEITPNDTKAPVADTDAPAADAPKQEATPVARVQATNFQVADGAEALMNPTIETITNGKITSIGDLLSAVDAAEAAALGSSKLQQAYRDTIAAYEAGQEDVDEAGLGDAEAYDLSGFAGLATAHPMMAVLDNMLAEKVQPATNFSELIDRITIAEKAVADGTAAIKALKRELRRAKPKDRQKVEATQSSGAAAYAQTLSEIDELNAECEVVMEMATDIFTKCYGQNAAVLGFEVPKMDFGAAHPEVPAVDPSFRFHTKVLVEALSAIADNQIIWLHGESGCGKSEFCAQVAAYLNLPFTRINLDGHLTRSDIVGGMKLVSDGQGGQETRFVEGALPRAMARPGLLLIDEFDLGDPEIMPIFQPVLEGKPIVLLEDGGRIVRPHPMFRIILTGNTIGLGSDNQMYLNAFEQSAATRDRISAFVEMQYMPPNIEKDVVLARMPDADPDFVEKLIQLANKVREGYRNQEIHQLFSTRAVQFCATRFQRFGPLYPTPEQAAREILETVILNRMDGASRQVVHGLVDNIF